MINKTRRAQKECSPFTTIHSVLQKCFKVRSDARLYVVRRGHNNRLVCKGETSHYLFQAFQYLFTVCDFFGHKYIHHMFPVSPFIIGCFFKIKRKIGWPSYTQTQLLIFGHLIDLISALTCNSPSLVVLGPFCQKVADGDKAVKLTGQILFCYCE